MSVANGNAGQGGGSRELHTWKEIGEYLSVTSRTAQAWEQERGLPVHRLPGGRGRVIAHTAEIDEWKATAARQNGNGTTTRRRRALVAIAVTLTAAIFAGAWILWPRPAPVGFRVDGLTLVAIDQGGHNLWRYAIPNHHHYVLDRTSQQPYVKTADLDGDGRNELLVNVEANAPSPERNGLLICLSSSGKENWRFSPGRHVKSPVDDFPLPYRIPEFEVIRVSYQSEVKIVVSGHHLTLYANQVALLNASTGQIERQYWHSGALQRLLVHDANGDGRPEIYLGGIHNASKQAVLVVLDPETMGGASVEGNPDYQIGGFEPGREVGRVYFPASCHTRKLGQYNQVAALRPQAGGIEVHVWDPIPGQDLVSHHYMLGPSLSLRSMLEGDNVRGIHNGLHLQGFLDHDLTEAERAAKRNILIVRPGQPAPAAPPSAVY